MKSQSDIYKTAQLLLEKYGSAAEDYAWQKMQEEMQQDDIKKPTVWFSIICAIGDIARSWDLHKQNKLH